MQRLIILRGNSGSGKTTVARLLQGKFGPNTMLISSDMVRMEMLHVWGQQGIEKSQPLMIELLKYGKQHSEITILEGVLPADAYDTLFQTALQEYGNHILAYYYDIPFEETLIRHKTKPNCNDFGEEDMRRWWREKDYLGIIPEKTLYKEISLENAVERIYEDCINDMGKRGDTDGEKSAQ